EFLQLLRVIDINLDSIGWTGGITTMRSLALDCPVVTIPGEFMRGRHSSAMLQMIGVEELVANSLDEYIHIASKLGNSEFRNKMIEAIKENKLKLFDDMECIHALDKFFKSEVAKVRADADIYPGVGSDRKAVSLEYETAATVGSGRSLERDAGDAYGTGGEVAAPGVGDSAVGIAVGEVGSGAAGGAEEPPPRPPLAMLLVRCEQASEAYPFFFRENTCDDTVIDQLFKKSDYSLRRLRINSQIEEYRKLKESEGLRPFILDLGANIGAAAVWFQQAYLTSRVVSVEPDDENYRLLLRNSSGLDCLAIKGAVASQKGFVKVCDPGLGAFGLRTELDSNGTVETFTIPELMESECKKGFFPFIAKIDVEGAEEELFSQNTDWIDAFPVLIVELHDWLLPGQNNSLNFLKCMAARKRDFVYLGENVFSIRTPVGG
ncbi:MAG: FkbM family methyltransferase, partial [Cyanobacteria bacterium]|nr:FkbM family methyltransferase [Cyanobacteriota bacterium]